MPTGGGTIIVVDGGESDEASEEPGRLTVGADVLPSSPDEAEDSTLVGLGAALEISLEEAPEETDEGTTERV